jgi:hypothetical protein
MLFRVGPKVIEHPADLSFCGNFFATNPLRSIGAHPGSMFGGKQDDLPKDRSFPARVFH